MQQIENSDNVSSQRIGWLCFKKMVEERKEIKLSYLAKKLYDVSLPSFDVVFQIKKYADYISYIKSNFHGGCNDNFLTKHERIFNHMFPELRSQISYGTGKDGYKKYGVKRYIADFVDDACKVIIEIDGENHKEPLQTLKDNLREIFFIENGYMVVRFTNEEVDKLYKIFCNIIADEVESGDNTRELKSLKELIMDI